MAACAAPPAIGMANPASVACVNQGGKNEIRDSAAGQFSVCVFPDGRQCEEWTLHREGALRRADPGRKTLIAPILVR